MFMAAERSTPQFSIFICKPKKLGGQKNVLSSLLNTELEMLGNAKH